EENTAFRLWLFRGVIHRIGRLYTAIREFNPAAQSAISSGGSGIFLLLLRPCTIVSDAGTLPSGHPHTKWTTPPGLRFTSPGKTAFACIWNLPRKGCRFK